MLPKLYYGMAIPSYSFGFEYIGTLTHCTKCQITEVRNGAYTMSLETTVNDDHAGEITPQRIIAAKANPFDPEQFFDIQTVERGIDGKIKVEAKHLKNRCFQICSEGDISAEVVPPETGTPQQIWNLLFQDYITTSTPFMFSSDISTSNDFSLGINTAETLGNILGGKEGSFLDVWGGEYHWDNYNISLLASRGRATGYQLRFGSNISDLIQTVSRENTYTHVLTYGKVAINGGQKINFFAPLYAIPNSESAYPKVFLLDCNDLLEGYEVGAHGENYSTVRAAMTNYAQYYAAKNGLGKTKVSISVTLRAALDEMSQLGLCDTVKVVVDELGNSTTAKITEVVYDTLLERWDKINVGTIRTNLADMIINEGRR